MRPRIFASFLSFICVIAFAGQVMTPRIGFAHYADGSLRAVSGVASAFVVSDALLRGADAASFSDAGGLISGSGKIQLVDSSLAVIAEYGSAETNPVLNVDGPLDGAVAWLPSSHVLLHWTGTEFRATSIDDSSVDRVLSVRMKDTATAEFLIAAAKEGVLRAEISLETGAVRSINVVPGVTGSAFLQQGFVISQDQNGLQVLSASGRIQTIPFAGRDLRFERMSANWVHIVSTATHQDWALHVGSRITDLSELPTPAGAAVLSASEGTAR
jgi:hypothetical protein